MSVEEAAAALGVCPSRLHKLRHTGMQGLVGACEPKKTGRPSSQAERDPEAAAEIARLQHELATEKRERLADQIRFELRLQEARKPGKRR